MTGQLTIAEAVASPDRWTVRAAAYHREHPEVMDELVWELTAIADAYDDAGRPIPTVSIRDLFGVLRRNRLRHASDTDGFHLNNNYCGFYGREIIAHHPRLAPMVTTRARRTDHKEPLL